MSPTRVHHRGPRVVAGWLVAGAVAWLTGGCDAAGRSDMTIVEVRTTEPPVEAGPVASPPLSVARVETTPPAELPPTTTILATTPPTRALPTTAPPTADLAPQQFAASGDCDPSYPDVCIPPWPPDLDCGDITERRFQVVGPDLHDFDGDGDGVGCEWD